jgi:hypothetical protein
MKNPKVFISYSSQDRDWARAFAESLKEFGADVWFDQWMLLPGQAWPATLEKGLRESDVFAVVVNPAVSFRPNFLFEVGAAVGLGKRVVPILPSEVESSDLPYLLRVRQGILRETPEATAKKLVEATQGG